MIGAGGDIVRTYREDLVLNEGAVERRIYRGDGHSEKLVSIRRGRAIHDAVDPTDEAAA